MPDPGKEGLKACRKNGKHPGLGGVNDDDLVRKYVGMGMRYMSTGTDVGYMMAGAGQRARFFRGLDGKSSNLLSGR